MLFPLIYLAKCTEARNFLAYMSWRARRFPMNIAENRFLIVTNRAGLYQPIYVTWGFVIQANLAIRLGLGLK